MDFAHDIAVPVVPLPRFPAHDLQYIDPISLYRNSKPGGRPRFCVSFCFCAWERRTMQCSHRFLMEVMTFIPRAPARAGIAADHGVRARGGRVTRRREACCRAAVDNGAMRRQRRSEAEGIRIAGEAAIVRPRRAVRRERVDIALESSCWFVDVKYHRGRRR